MSRLLRRLRAAAAHLIALGVVAVLLAPILLVAHEALPAISPAIRQALRTPLLAQQAMNGALLAMSTATLCALLAPGAGYALSLRQLPFRRGWVRLLIAVVIAPVTLILVPAEIVLASVNLRDSLWGIGFLELGLSLPLAIWIMTTAFERLPPDLLEAARFEGATPFRVYRTIALPLVRRAQAVVWACAFAFSWGEYVVSMTFLLRPTGQTVPAALIAASRAGVPWEHLIAPLLLGALPTLLFLLAVQLEIDRWTGLDRFLAARHGARGAGMGT